MKNKNTIAIVLVLTIAVTALAFGSQSPLTAGLFNFTPKAKAQSGSQIPTHILYDQMFRLTVSFRRKAEIQRLKGGRVTSLPDYFKEEAKLTDEQNEILQRVAIEFIQEVQPVDDQATVLISQIREAFPDGVVPDGQEVPPPPPELANLQNQRNSAALARRDQLEELFGKDKFTEFDKFIQGGFAANFQAIQR